MQVIAFNIDQLNQTGHFISKTITLLIYNVLTYI